MCMVLNVFGVDEKDDEELCEELDRHLFAMSSIDRSRGSDRSMSGCVVEKSQESISNWMDWMSQ